MPEMEFRRVGWTDGANKGPVCPLLKADNGNEGDHQKDDFMKTL